MEWLNSILGEMDNKEEVIEGIKKGIGENFVPNDVYKKKVDKFKESESELEVAKTKLEETNSTLEGLKGKADNVEEVKSQLEAIKSEYEEYKQQEESRVNQIRKKSTLEKQLLKSSANQDAVDLLLNDFDVDSLELDEEGNLNNFDEQLKRVQEKRPTLFGKIEIAGDTPSDGQGGEGLLINADTLDNLTEQQINDNWDKVSKILEGN